MPINVNVLKERVESLAVKSQNGYVTSSQYNSDLQAANIVIYEYYYKQFEETQKILDCLLPFVKEVTLSLTQSTLSATVPFPSDYFHRLQLGVLKVTNNPSNDCSDGKCKKKSCRSCNQPTASNQTATALPPIINPLPCDYINTDELFYTLSSSIRKPSVSKGIYRHTFFDNLIHVYPKETRSIYFKYLRQPAVPFWNSAPVSTPNGDFEQYTSIGSTQIEFPETELETFTDILLYFIGIEIRESAILNFVKGKQQENLVR